MNRLLLTILALNCIFAYIISSKNVQALCRQCGLRSNNGVNRTWRKALEESVVRISGQKHNGRNVVSNKQNNFAM